MKQPDHDYHETTRDRDDRPIDPTCAYCGKPKHLCEGGAKQTTSLETPGKLKRLDFDALLDRVEQGARAVERAKIVAWLRDGADIDWDPAIFQAQIADAIERGEHLKGGDHD